MLNTLVIFIKINDQLHHVVLAIRSVLFSRLFPLENKSMDEIVNPDLMNKQKVMQEKLYDLLWTPIMLFPLCDKLNRWRVRKLMTKRLCSIYTLKYSSYCQMDSECNASYKYKKESVLSNLLFWRICRAILQSSVGTKSSFNKAVFTLKSRIFTNANQTNQCPCPFLNKKEREKGKLSSPGKL